jgi:hypothetical protein
MEEHSTTGVSKGRSPWHHLDDWAAAGGGEGGGLVAEDFLVTSER